MNTRPLRSRVRAAAILLPALMMVMAVSLDARARKGHVSTPAGKGRAPQSYQGGPKIWLQDRQPLGVTHVPADGTAQNKSAAKSLAAGQGQPLAMIHGDFDQDGVEDLAVGYATPGGGAIVVHRGNLDAFAPQSDASFQAIGRGEFPAPFLPQAKVVGIPIRPDFLAAGNFTGKGNTDLVAASKGGNALYIFPGDGKGNFGQPQILNLSGGVTALAAGNLGNGQAFTNIVAGIANSQKSFSLLVLGGTGVGFGALASYPLSAPASNIVFGDLDGDARPDMAVLAGGQVLIYHGASGQLEPVSLPFSVQALALGSFVFDRDSREQMALLSADGTVHIAAHSSFDPRAFTLNEWRIMRQATVNGLPNPVVPAPVAGESWTIVESFASVAPFGAGQPPVLFRTRISGNAADDVMVLSGSAGQMAVISHPNLKDSAATFTPGEVSTRNYSGSPVAALPMRINVDGRPGVVALHSGQVAPAVMVPLPDPTFTVDTTNDVLVANACSTPIPGSCSLREAIEEANAAAGVDTIMVPAGTYTLTIANATANGENANATGDLDITDGVSIVGAVDINGVPTTIVQAGPSAGTGIDKVFSVNPLFTTAFDTSFSNMEIRFGKNQASFGTNGFGGGFDWEASHTGTMTVTNCNIHDNTIADGSGGGITATNTGGGTGQFTISNSTVSSNVAARPAGNTARGGGIFFGAATRFTITNTHIENNNAITSNGEGGGIFVFNPGTTPISVIHGGTFTGNTAIIRGGGIRTTAGITIDQGTVISNNAVTGTPTGDGAGLWSNLGTSAGFPSGETTTLSKVTITGNTAAGHGGGVMVDNSASGNFFVMSFSRIAGNTAPALAGSNLFTTNPGGAVTATNNWWGTNTPATTVGGGATVNCPTPGAGQVCFDPFIVLTNTASPSTVNVNASTTLTASFLQDNHGTPISVSNLDVLVGVLPATPLPITFGNAIRGSISVPDATIQSNGTATATFTAGPTGFPGPQPQAHADATVDNGTATADITIPLPPVTMKAFGAASIPLNGSTSLTFTLNNANAVSLSGIAFTDTLPAGLVISTPSGLTGPCGSGTITATQGTNVISLSGGTLAASPGSCTFAVNVTGTAAGDQNNTTGSIAATESGSGGTASASITVVAPPSIAKAFNPTTIALNATTSLTFTITNPAANTVAETGVAFTDTLPTGLTVANASATVCGGTLTTTAPTGIALSGASINTNSQCQFSVTVTGAASGVYTNTTGAVTSTNGGTGNTASANLTVASPPTISKAFGASQIPLNGTTSLTFNITNPNTNVALTGLAFTDNLPLGLTVSLVGLSNTCGGVVSSGSPSDVSLTGGTLAASANCAITVNVTGTTTAGVKSNTTGAISSNETGAGSPSNTTPITVVAPPTLSKAFGAATIPLNGSTSLQFTIQNNNAGNTLSGIGFTDNLPAGLTVSLVGLSNTCGGVVSSGSSSNVSLSGGSLAASGSCLLSVNVTGIAAGAQNNTTGNVTSTEGGTGGTASASITVVAPPSIAKAFNPMGIQPNGVSAMTITITNAAANGVAENGVAVTDNLPANLVVATPNGLTNTCGGTATATAGSGSVSLTGGTVAASSSCTVGVNVTSSVTGTYLNTTGAVTSTNGGTGGSASATLFVAFPPTISKVFVPDTTFQNGTSLLSFTISNPNSSAIDPTRTDMALTGIAFTDSLPAGLVVAPSPSMSNDCGGVVTAVPGSSSISLSGGSLNPAVGLITHLRGPSRVQFQAQPIANGSCFISVKVQATATAPATLSNTTGPISANESGPGAISNTASLTVTTPPTPPTITKAFGAASIPLNGTTSLTFAFANPNSSIALVNTSVSDTLPSGLAVANPNGLTGTCVTAGVDVIANPGSGTITVTSLNLPGNGSCSFSVNVTGTTVGTKNNTSGNVTATFDDGTGTFVLITGGTASASILVIGPPSMSKAFNPVAMGQNDVSTLSFTITNPAGNPVTLTGVAFTDTLPANLVVATPNGLTGSCGGGTITATAGSGSVSLSGATLASGAQCTFSVNVTSSVIGLYNNSTMVTSANGGNGNTASATLTVGPPLSISPITGAEVVPAGTTATYLLTVTSLSPSLGNILFNCLNLPFGAACNFNPMTDNQIGPVQVTLTISTTANLASVFPGGMGRTAPVYAALLFPLPLLGLVGIFASGRKSTKARLRLGIFFVGLLGVLAFAGCQGPGKQQGTPRGSFPVSVTATSSAKPSVQASTTVILTVQ